MMSLCRREKSRSLKGNISVKRGGDFIAYTKIWAVHTRLDHVIDYVENPEKTRNPDYQEAGYEDLETALTGLTGGTEYRAEKALYVSGLNVDPATAYESMMATQALSSRGKILAFHGIQSFEPGEVTPEVCHEIGVKLAERLWGDRFEVIVSTHLDEEHLHNHFVVNAVSFVDGRRWKQDIHARWELRDASDELCREYGLSVIEHPRKGQGQNYAEWQAEQEGRPTKRGSIRRDIDAAIRESGSMDEFLRILQKRGYRIRLTGKHPAVLAPGADRWNRLYKLGSAYELEAIAKRIRNRRTPPQHPAKQRYRNHRYQVSIGKLLFPGIRGYYYRLLYDIGVLPNKRARQIYRRPKEDRRAVYRLDRYSEELRLLSKYRISAITELQMLEGRLKTEKEEHPEQAKRIQRELRTCKRIRERFEKDRVR